MPYVVYWFPVLGRCSITGRSVAEMVPTDKNESKCADNQLKKKKTLRHRDAYKASLLRRAESLIATN